MVDKEYVFRRIFGIIYILDPLIVDGIFLYLIGYEFVMKCCLEDLKYRRYK